MEVDNADGDKFGPAIVPVKVPESLGSVSKLAYSGRSKPHVLHHDGKVTLFDPSTNKSIFLEAPQEIIDKAMSPNGNCIVTLQCVGKVERAKSLHAGQL